MTASVPADAGRRLWAGLDLLDHQIVDPDGRMAGKVDDLELEVPEDDGLPVVATILSGLGALAGQIGGDTGRWLARMEARITGAGEGNTGTISFRLVTRVEEHVEVAVSREALDSNRAEQWVRDVVVAHIPGAGDAGFTADPGTSVVSEPTLNRRRLSGLLGCSVVTIDGEELGHVHDALLVQDGPPASAHGAFFRLHGLAIGPHSIGTRLGVTQGHVERPALLRRIFGWSAVVVPWSAVREIEERRIVVDVAGLELADAATSRDRRG